MTTTITTRVSVQAIGPGHVNAPIHTAFVSTSSLNRPKAATKCWLNWVVTSFVVVDAPATCPSCTKV